MKKQTVTRKKRRNAVNTREAILTSARRAFAKSGYDGAGVREIATGAGVTAMLVNRYFGSKEQLFTEVVAANMNAPTILSSQNLASPDFSKALATALVRVTKVEDDPLEGFLILLRSSSSPPAAAIGRREIEKGHQKALTEALKGDLAAQRAAVLLSLIAGFQVMRQMFGLSALAKADSADLLKVLTPVFQQLIGE